VAESASLESLPGDPRLLTNARRNLFCKMNFAVIQLTREDTEKQLIFHASGVLSEAAVLSPSPYHLCSILVWKSEE
jgi:hypothetical protein